MSRQAAPSGVACSIYISLPNDSTICFMKKGTFVMLLGCAVAMNAVASEVGVTPADSSRSASALCQIDEIIIEEDIARLPVVTADPASAAIDTTANYDFSRANARKAPTSSLMPSVVNGAPGFTFSCVF